MQKRMVTTNSSIGNNRGSALLAAVVMAIIMAIGCIGFLALTTNTVNNETTAYENDKAFQAGESCAMIAQKWLDTTQRGFPSNQWSTQWDGVKSGFLGRNLNGFNVDVAMTFSGGTPNIATIQSTVYTTDPTKWKKRIFITVQ